MKILVLSDSHGNVRNVEEAFKRCRDCDLAVFLGDGIGDFESAAAQFDIQTAAVKGNCDIFVKDYPETRVIDIGKYRIMITHGHRFGVKYGLDTLKKEAYDRNCDIVLFGHTHQREEIRAESGETGKKIVIFNPGAASSSYGKKPSFGRIHIIESGKSFSVVCSYGDL